MVWGNLATGYWLGGAAAAGLHWVELGRGTLSGTSDTIDVKGDYPTLPSATLTEDFADSTSHSSDGTTVNGWYADDADKTYYNGTNNRLQVHATAGAMHKAASFDLEQSGNGGLSGTSINATKWTLRFKFEVTSNSGSDSINGNYFFVGITANAGNSTNHIFSSQDGMGCLFMTNRSGTSDGVRVLAKNNAGMWSLDDDISSALTTGTYYIEIVRNSDECTVTLRTGSHTGTVVGSASESASEITGLRYISVLPSYDSSGGGGSPTFEGYIDDIEFYDGHAHLAADLTAKPYLMFLTHRPAGSGNVTGKITYNGDTGSNYAIRWNDNGGTDGSGTGRSNLDAYYAQGVDEFGVHYVSNIAGEEKLGINHITSANTAGGGNAPNRYEIVNKWANTSDQITSVKFANDGAGDFSAGTEVVVLGYDPDDTEGTSFWEELASVELGSSSTSLSSGTFTAKKYLWVQVYLSNSGTVDTRLRFNSDSGSNYTYRFSDNGGADSTATSEAGLPYDRGHDPQLINMYIINKSDKEKLVISEINARNTAGAGNAPVRREFVAKWTNTSDSITNLTFTKAGSGANLESPSSIKVWGFD